MRTITIARLSLLLPAVAAAALLSLVYIASAAGGADGGHGAHGHRSLPIERTERSVEFRNDMRQLWEDHIVWTRLFIVSSAADLPDAGPTTDRLLANQAHIGNAIKPFYGDAAGDQLAALLREHILGAAAVLSAAKAGETAAFEAARDAWYVNGEQIAAFLTAANPENWPADETGHHMRMHLDLTLAEAADRLAGNFNQDISDYDAVHQAILEMADFLSLGIIHQFPQQFRGAAAP
jgi:hypothetical protein